MATVKMVARGTRLDIITSAGHVSVYRDGVVIVTNCLLHLEDHQLDEMVQALGMAKQLASVARSAGDNWLEQVRPILGGTI